MRLQPIASLLCATCVLCLVPSAIAQAAASFPDEPYVVTKAITTVSMNADATGERVFTFAVRIQSQAALQQFSVATISFASQAEKASFVYVRAIHPDGTTQETDVAQTIEQPAPVTQQAPFYSDLEIKQLPVKSLHVGDTLEWQARFTVDHPEVPGQIWGQDSFIQNAVALDETYELRVPSTVHLNVWTNPSFKESFSESTESELTSTGGATPTSSPPSAPQPMPPQSRRDPPPHPRGRARPHQRRAAHRWPAPPSPTGPPSAPGTASSPPTASPRCRHQGQGRRAHRRQDHRPRKARALYNYVRRTSATSASPSASAAISRTPPPDVLGNQYGDCKDKHTLLAAMLSVLDLHADAVLIGAGIRFNHAVPSPAAFNHLITRLTLDGAEVWLDTTAEVGPLARPHPAHPRSRGALLIASPAAIVNTPADLPYPRFPPPK